MSKCTLTIEDRSDGDSLVKVEVNPPLAHLSRIYKENGRFTPAEEMLLVALNFLWKNGKTAHPTGEEMRLIQ